MRVKKQDLVLRFLFPVVYMLCNPQNYFNHKSVHNAPASQVSQIDSMLLCIFSVIQCRSQMTSKCGKNKTSGA